MFKGHLKQAGFTIVELLVVIVVIGVLAAITIVSYTGITRKATIASIQADLSSASSQLKLDQVVSNAYPDTLAAANNGRGIPSSQGTVLQYSADNTTSPSSFCITATKDSISYKITNDTAPVAGLCPDYGLTMRLDAGNPASYPGSGTIVTDLSGNGNNGTLVNGVGYSGASGGVFDFDGANDYVNSGGNLEWPGAFSVASWHYRTTKDLVNADAIVGNWFWDTLTVNRRGWALRYYLNSDSLLFIIEVTNGTLVQEMSVSYTTSINSWYHAVGVFDPSDRTVKLYVNGVLRSTATAPAGYDQIAYDSLNQMLIGYNAVNAGYFYGQINDVRIHNRVLGANEINQSFNNLKGRYGL